MIVGSQLRVVYVSLALNAVAFAIKLRSALVTDSSSVDASLLHALGDLIGSALLALGVLLMNLRPSFRYPFGLGRSVYVFGLLSSSIVAGYLFSLTLSEGFARLSNPVVESSYEGLALMTVALVADASVLAWVLLKYGVGTENPALKGTLVENLVDTVSNVTALTALVTLNYLIDAYGAFLISGILLVSSINLSYKYFNILVGRTAPKDVVGRAIKIAASHPYIIDVNDVKSMSVGPDSYLLIMRLESNPGTSVEELERVREEIKEKLRLIEPKVKYLIIEFETPKEPPSTFRDLLRKLITIKD